MGAFEDAAAAHETRQAENAWEVVARLKAKKEKVAGHLASIDAAIQAAVDDAEAADAEAADWVTWAGSSEPDPAEVTAVEAKTPGSRGKAAK